MRRRSATSSSSAPSRSRHIHSGDYERIVRKYDSPDAVFYLDPPYPGYNVDVGESDFDEARFLAVLKSIKGKFLVTYDQPREVPERGRAAQGRHRPQAGLQEDPRALRREGHVLLRRPALPGRVVRQGRRHRRGGVRRGARGASWPVHRGPERQPLPHLENALPRIPQSRIPGLTADDLAALQDKARRLIAEAHRANKTALLATAFAKSIPLIKGTDPGDERFVLGIVLGPELVDAQGDIYSADEVRLAAHRFMEDFGGLGLMHRMRVNGQVKVLESYLAPSDLAIGDATVRKGRGCSRCGSSSTSCGAEVGCHGSSLEPRNYTRM